MIDRAANPAPTASGVARPPMSLDELDRWLRGGRATAAIVRPDRAVMQAGKNIQALSDALPAFSAVHRAPDKTEKVTQ